LNVGSFAALAALLLIAKLTFIDRTETPFRRPALQPEHALPGIGHVLNQPYADGLTLIGYDLDRSTIPADDVLRVDLYWTAHAEPTARYQSVIHLVGPDGLRWSLPDTFRPRGYAKYPSTNTWSPGRYALDSQEVEPMPGSSPGVYDVVLTMFDRDTLAPLSILDENGQPAAPEMTLGQVTLTSPHDPVDPDELGDLSRLDAALEEVFLLTADVDRDQAAPGDPVFLITFWQTEERPATDATFTVELVASDGSLAAEFELVPGAPWHPTSAWQPGDVWRGQHLIRLPADLGSGDYTWQITSRSADQPVELPTVIHITAPAHTFSTPPIGMEIGTRLGDVATLVGADVEPGDQALYPAGSVNVTLVWRAEGTASESYHVFVHLLDSEGRVIAQSDTIPAGWTRPTTGWLQGEYIIDEHTLTIPATVSPGSHTLAAGLYIPGGARLATPQGTDAVPLARVTIQDESD
jgi:hypothetical protein